VWGSDLGPPIPPDMPWWKYMAHVLVANIVVFGLCICPGVTMCCMGVYLSIYHLFPEKE